MVTMTLGTISICVTVLVLNVHHRYPAGRPSPWLRRFILIHVARLLRVTTSYSQASREAEQVWKRRPGFEPRAYFQVNGIASSEDGVKTRLKNRLNNGQRLKDYFTRSLLRHHPHQRQQHPHIHHNSSTTQRSSAPFAKSTADDETQQQQQTATKDYGPEWRELAQVLDRLFFWILCVLMTSSTVFILLYPKYSGIEGSW